MSASGRSMAWLRSREGEARASPAAHATVTAVGRSTPERAHARRRLTPGPTLVYAAAAVVRRQWLRAGAGPDLRARQRSRSSPVKIFIDSADVNEIREAARMGAVDGVTTNPSLVAKTGRKYLDVVKEICELVDGPISAEVLGVSYEDIIREGREWAKVHKNIVVKVPLIVEGLKAVRTLTNEGIKTNVTLCFSPTQAMLAAKAGATYISPFVGRLDDAADDGMELIDQIVTIYRNYHYTTEVLVASVRHPVHVVQSALMGADVCTIPFKVIEQLAKHPLTDVGLAKFLEDAKKIPR
jgi:transaldolase